MRSLIFDLLVSGFILVGGFVQGFRLPVYAYMEPVFETCYDDFGSDFWVNYGNILSGVDTNSSLARTLSCPQSVSAAKQSSNFKKRKAEKNLNLKEAKEDGNKDKKLKISMSNDKETSDISKEKSKATSEVQKTDCIHVRARQGEATGSHSLAERFLSMKLAAVYPGPDFKDLLPGMWPNS